MEVKYLSVIVSKTLKYGFYYLSDEGGAPELQSDDRDCSCSDGDVGVRAENRGGRRRNRRRPGRGLLRKSWMLHWKAGR